MKNFGIFLAFSPEQPINNQWMGRWMVSVLTSVLENNDTKVVIATTARSKELIVEFMQDQHIDTTKIEFLATSDIPYLLRMVKAFSHMEQTRSHSLFNKKKKSSLLLKVLREVKSVRSKILITWVSSPSATLFFLIGFLLLILGILRLPFIVLALIIYANKFLYRKTYNWLRTRIPRRITVFLKNPIKAAKSSKFARKVYEKLQIWELQELVVQINKRQDVSVWFIPSLYCPEIKLIQAKKVVAVSDIIFVDFSTLLLELPARVYSKAVETIAIADHFICNSEYVKQKHLVKSFDVDPRKVSVISHGAMDLSSCFGFGKVLDEEKSTPSRNAAVQILDQYQKRFLQHNCYLHNYALNSMRYIFYSSQMLPYKNFLNLIKAYEILLRRRFLNIKLVVTADLTQDAEVYNYVIDKRLQYDVISLTNLPSEVLAALNHLAICAVNPTLFEGGFPFTFTEAYSVGTPSLMSDIPVVISEVTEKELQQRMLFDPFNVEDMVIKIEWAVKNRELLYSLQEPLYKRFKHRTWDVVAKEFIDLFRKLAFEHE